MSMSTISTNKVANAAFMNAFRHVSRLRVFDKIVMSMHEASEVRRGNVFIRVFVSLCLSACPWRVY